MKKNSTIISHLNILPCESDVINYSYYLLCIHVFVYMSCAKLNYMKEQRVILFF